MLNTLIYELEEESLVKAERRKNTNKAVKFADPKMHLQLSGFTS